MRFPPCLMVSGRKPWGCLHFSTNLCVPQRTHWITLGRCHSHPPGRTRAPEADLLLTWGRAKPAHHGGAARHRDTDHSHTGRRRLSLPAQVAGTSLLPCLVTLGICLAPKTRIRPLLGEAHCTSHVVMTFHRPSPELMLQKSQRSFLPLQAPKEKTNKPKNPQTPSDREIPATPQR